MNLISLFFTSSISVISIFFFLILLYLVFSILFTGHYSLLCKHHSTSRKAKLTPIVVATIPFSLFHDGNIDQRDLPPKSSWIKKKMHEYQLKHDLYEPSESHVITPNFDAIRMAKSLVSFVFKTDHTMIVVLTFC